MDSGAIRLARDALATPELRRLQIVAAAAGVGGWAFMVSLAVHAYVIGGAAAVGLAAHVRMAPAGLAAPLTGLAADRFPRRDDDHECRHAEPSGWVREYPHGQRAKRRSRAGPPCS